MPIFVAIWLLLAGLGLACSAAGNLINDSSTERRYLSGTGLGDGVDWEFQIDRGRGAGSWIEIPVPSQWELQGLGRYAYGKDDPEARLHAEVGRYRHEFVVPRAWRGRLVRLVFEGVMTDAVVKVNGRSAGPPHRGGFTRFAYDVSDRLEYGGSNLLEVEVSEASADGSVNRAEREADYWVFGGIYRPVYLESLPARSISNVAIDARHDGELAVEIELVGVEGGEEVTVQVREIGPRASEVGPALTGRVDGGRDQITIRGRIPGVEAWSAERPRLYFLDARLSDDGHTLHRPRAWKFGFRTIELRPDQGLFVNGHRVLLKGVNRHSFWPESGRTLNRGLNRRDAELIKGLNANAVRTSHYPPDSSFLEACDELGIYVVDELPGWHDAYRSGIGSRLIGELVRRDVNHPSVILWANGNEGGWNSLLDGEFGRHDPQRRPVIHPGSTAAGVNARHYPTYAELRESLGSDSSLGRLLRLGKAPDLVLPTEMLHGLYDGGGGAGLADYWRAISSSPRGAGGFLWALLDEGVVRTDRAGAIDTRGNYAPDGIVGPYREPEASYQAVRQIWSPIEIESADWQNGLLDVRNRFFRTDLSECTLRWQGLAVPDPVSGSEPRVLFELERRGPRIGPGQRGRVSLGGVPDEAFDVLRLVALDPHGREIGEWAGWNEGRSDLLESWLPVQEGAVAGAGSAPPGWIESVEQIGAVGAEDFSTGWTEYASGWIRLEVERSGNMDPNAAGFTLRLADFEPSELEWLGDGPWPVWANRLAGPQPGVWRRSVDRDTPGRSARGFYSGVRWMRLSDRTLAGSVTVAVGSEGLFVGVLAPDFPGDAQNARAEVPALGTISFLSRVPAIGTKFHRPIDLAPVTETEVRDETASRRDVVWLRFDPHGRGL